MSKGAHIELRSAGKQSGWLHLFSRSNNNTFIIDGSGNISCASTLNVAS